jgi:prophage antirepressor-like protein
MSFIIDVFENLLKYNDKQVFIVLDIDNNIWFKMKDILKVLDYSNARKAVQLVKVDKKYKQKYKNLKLYPLMGTALNFQKSSIFINEAGLYQLLSNSTKPLASKFRDELFTIILPQIRQNGMYKLKENDNNKLKKLNQKLIIKIKKVNEENNYYEDKHIYKPTSNSYIYILKKDIGRHKCYKIGYTDDIKTRMQVYKTGKADLKIIFYMDIVFDGKQTENCIKNINKLHKLKKKTDDLCYLSLNALKNSINDCLSILKSHICKCTFCKKKFKFDKIDSHICD